MEPPNESNPPLRPLPPPSPYLSSSLPEDIVLSILARISKSYYPTLSLVSKSFRSLILSKELDMMRSHLGTREDCVYVCLQTPTLPCYRIWFSLWIKPDDHQPLTDLTAKDKSTGNLLLPVPSSYSPRLPIINETVGSETYEIGGHNTPSSTDVWVYDKLGKRRKGPNMTVARTNAFMCSLDGKLYVIGGCEPDESTCWAEVFDPKTQTWEPLPDPGAEVRYSVVKKIETQPEGKIYVRSTENNFVYLTKESRWAVVAEMVDSWCEIENVLYCDVGMLLWYDTKWPEWKEVHGLTSFYRHCRVNTQICNYGGKLLVFWLSPARYSFGGTSSVWCALITLVNRYGEVWGYVEWEDMVLSWPDMYDWCPLLHSIVSSH